MLQSFDRGGRLGAESPQVTRVRGGCKTVEACEPDGCGPTDAHWGPRGS
ncbi:hypothetical protein AB0P07_34355 [Streptomyces sp. NPDC085944]